MSFVASNLLSIYWFNCSLIPVYYFISGSNYIFRCFLKLILTSKNVKLLFYNSFNIYVTVKELIYFDIFKIKNYFCVLSSLRLQSIIVAIIFWNNILWMRCTRAWPAEILDRITSSFLCHLTIRCFQAPSFSFVILVSTSFYKLPFLKWILK